jgi:hypothetical protein
MKLREGSDDLRLRYDGILLYRRQNISADVD